MREVLARDVGERGEGDVAHCGEWAEEIEGGKVGGDQCLVSEEAQRRSMCLLLRASVAGRRVEGYDDEMDDHGGASAWRFEAREHVGLQIVYSLFFDVGCCVLYC